VPDWFLTPQRRNARPMRHRILSWQFALLLVIALHAAGAFFAAGLNFNNSPQVYYAPGSPAVVLRAELRRLFPDDEVLTILLRGKDLYSIEVLRRLDRFSRELERHPMVDRVASVVTVERISGSADGFTVGKLIDVAKLKRETPEELRRRVMADRFAPGMLASQDPEYMAVIVRPKALSSSGERVELKLAAARAVDDAGLRPYYAGDAGPITLDVAQLMSILEDSAIFVPVTVTIGLALMWWVVGRWRPMIIGAVAMSATTLPTIGAIVAAGQPYTMATAILPSLLSAYTSATLLHFYAAVQRGHAARLSRGRSIDRALAENLRPGIFNVLTTGAGLLSLLFVPIPPIQVFGAAGAFGTLLVFLVVYVLVPPFLRHWDKQRWPVRDSGLGRFGRLAPRMAIFSMRHARWIILAATAFTFALVPVASSVSVESDLLAFFKRDHPVSVETRLIEQKLSGVTTLEVLVDGGRPGALENVAILQRVHEFQRWAEALPEVDRSMSFGDLVQEMHWAMNGEKPAFRALPPTDRLLSQYLLIYDGRDLHELVDRSYRYARVMLSLNVHGAQAIGAAVDKIRARLASHPIPGVRVDIGGEGRLFADQSDLLISGQVNSFFSAFAQIFLFMMLLWRSALASAICLVPNLAPLFFVFVLMGLLSIHIDTATVMIASVVLGITVDDTIHLYHGYKERIRQGASPVFAIARGFRTTGPAVMAISVLLISQFALLAASDFVPTSNFGRMTAVGLFSGQLFELLLLPALLIWKDRRLLLPRGPDGR
jgi:predicted RND superfamily exporter protein